MSLRALLRFIDITLAVTLVYIIAYAVLRNRILTRTPKDNKDIKIALLFCTLLGAGLGLLDHLMQDPVTVTISSSGILLEGGGEFGVYKDVTGTNTVDHINWESLEPGDSKETQVWVKNEGTTPLTLTLDTVDWSPTNASDYLTLNWDWGDTPLYPDMSRRVTLTLTVSPDITGIDNFSFNIVLTS